MALRIHRMFRARQGREKGTLTWKRQDDGSSYFIWDLDSGTREEFTASSIDEPEMTAIVVNGRLWNIYKELPVTAPNVTTTAVSLPVRPHARPNKGE